MIRGHTEDTLLKIAKAGQSKTNACRNLHVLINKGKVLLPVPIDAVLLRVALRRPYFRKQELYWPVLRMEDWIKVLMARAPETLLAGCAFENKSAWMSILDGFWADYESCNPTHPIYSSTLRRSHSIPYFLHGDEGKTLRQRSFMIESFQPVISRKGCLVSNESGHPG